MKPLLSRIGAAVSVVTIVGLLLAASPDSLQIIEFPPYSGSITANNSILVSGPTAKDGRGAYRATLSELSGVIGGGGTAGTVINSGTPVDGALMIYNGTTGTNAKPAGITTAGLTNLTVPGNVAIGNNVYMATATATWSGATTVDFSSFGSMWAVLSGSVTLSSSGLSPTNGVFIRIDNPTATNCNVILPSGWRYMSGARTNILAAGKIGTLKAKSYSGSDTNVLSWWWSE